jgi:hypothetical protein
MTAEQGCHHGIVDKARLDAGAPLGRLVAVQFVDVGDRGHPKFFSLAKRHLPQRAGECARANEEGGVEDRAIDLAPQDASAIKVQKAFHEHLARAVKAGLE